MDHKANLKEEQKSKASSLVDIDIGVIKPSKENETNLNKAQLQKRNALNKKKKKQNETKSVKKR